MGIYHKDTLAIAILLLMINYQRIKNFKLKNWKYGVFDLYKHHHISLFFS